MIKYTPHTKSSIAFSPQPALTIPHRLVLVCMASFTLWVVLALGAYQVSKMLWP